MKHGPIALIDRDTPSVFVAPRGSLHAKTLSNVEEVRPATARSSPSAPKATTSSPRWPTSFLPIPDVPELVQPLLAVVPLQLLSYHVARLRGCDIDKPRNLAKSVTVE